MKSGRWRASKLGSLTRVGGGLALITFAVLANGVLLIRPDYSSRVAVDIVHTPLSIRGASIVLDLDRETPVKLNQLTREDRNSLIAAIKDARRQGEREAGSA